MYNCANCVKLQRWVCAGYIFRLSVCAFLPLFFLQQLATVPVLVRWTNVLQPFDAYIYVYCVRLSVALLSYVVHCVCWCRCRLHSVCCLIISTFFFFTLVVSYARRVFSFCVLWAYEFSIGNLSSSSSFSYQFNAISLDSSGLVWYKNEQIMFEA